MKIAVNKCYGGFSVSREVVDILRSKGYKIIVNGEAYPDGSICTSQDDWGYHLDNEDFNIESDNYRAYRNNKDLVEAIEKVGEQRASGKLADIKIIEIPNDIEWEIDEYDGIETIHEQHRSW